MRKSFSRIFSAISNLRAMTMDIVNACRAAVILDDNSDGKNDKVGKSFVRILNQRNATTEIVDEKEEFSAEKFVENLLNEGLTSSCDETSSSFNNHTELPDYYDEQMFKKGQSFFHKNIFGLFLSKLLGLMTMLTLNLSVKILVMTNMSSTDMTAYRRYMSTIFHMCLWYDEDFKPGSKSWKSIAKVRCLHNSASKRGSSCLNYRINQRDMAYTQFGFMGFGLVRSKLMGVHHATEEELRGFVHLWRVIGYVLGIEDRFNICRESVAETKEICNLLIEKVFRPALEKPSPEFDKMAKALINGMWAMNPILQYDLFLVYLGMAVENNNSTNRADVRQLGWRAKIKLYIIQYVLWIMQFDIMRIIHNYIQIVALWLMANCPFLAYYRFGKENSHVKIL